MSDESYSDTRFTAADGDIQVPVGWGSWPTEHQREYLRLSVTRASLLAAIRAEIGSERERDRLDKGELAGIALSMGVVA